MDEEKTEGTEGEDSGQGALQDETKASTFGGALEILRDGRAVTRIGWNGFRQYLKLQVPDENSKMRKPYIFISPVDGEFVPWIASQTDLLADDWEEVEGV